jgi:hypothetical protein
MFKCIASLFLIVLFCLESRSQNIKNDVLGGDHSISTFTISISPNDTICVGETVTLNGSVVNSSYGASEGNWFRCDSVGYSTFCGSGAAVLTFPKAGLYSFTLRSPFNWASSGTAIYVKERAQSYVTVPIILPYDTICITDQPFTLNSYNKGGTYSGSGVRTNVFEPAKSTLGNNEITYSYTEVDGCLVTSESNLFVRDCSKEEEPTDSSIFNVFPNPSPGIINLQSSLEIKSVKVYNTSGVLINTEVDKNVINLSQYPRGLYLLYILTENEIRKVKVYKE